MHKRIRIQPISFSVLLKCEIIRFPNQHIRARVEGYITDAEEVLYQNWENTEISVFESDENGKERRLFCGMADSITVEESGALKKLTFEAVSYTAQLDLKKQIRIFQNKKQTYEELVSFLAEANPRALFRFTESGSRLTDGMMMQYQETDWEFLLRLAAGLNTVVVPDCTNDRPCFYFGLPDRSDAVHLSSCRFRLRKNMEEFQVKKRSGLSSLGSLDTTDYIISSDQFLELCVPVEFQGKLLRVAKAVSRWENGELLHEYHLRSVNGFKTIPYNNPLICGLSMKGKVKRVKEDKIKVKIEGTAQGMDDDPQWFAFATVYASGTSVGWYCMPEPGDPVRICFPDACEAHAFAVSAVHLENQRGWKLSPEEKFIRTVDDKEIRMAPDRIEITNHKGMSIVINDNSGIEIKSDKNIQISSSDGISLNSGENISMKGKGGIFLKQNRNILAVCDGILEKAVKVEHR